MNDRLVRRLTAIVGGAFVGIASVAIVVDPVAATRQVSVTSAPILSVRRAPHVLRGAIGRDRLSARVASILADPVFAPARPRSCLVARVDGGMIVADGADRAVIPASTLKVLTAATALALIPPGSSFVTEVRASTAPLLGTMTGDLWLVGGGDPLLETSDYTTSQEHSPEIATRLETLADRVVAAGIQRIQGSIVGDDRRYDSRRRVETWKRAYMTSGEVGPIGALSINDNFTMRNARGQRIGAADVPRDAAAEFGRLLAERGVVITGAPRGAASAEEVARSAAPQLISSISSVPIESVVQEVLVWSDNTAAEMLLKELGFLSSKQPGSAASGVAAVAAFVRARSGERYSAVDGSGLDRSDSVTCRLLADVLESEPQAGPLEAALPVMGRTGTLRRRLRGDEAQGRVRAKTGSLNGVSALAGYADTRDGRRIVFAFVGNSLASTATGVAIGNQVTQALVGYPDAPDERLLELEGTS